jgi:outer membrane protein assembly factor BamB
LSLVFWLTRIASGEEARSGQSFGWRGDGSGRFPEAHPPIEWDGETGKNIVWKTRVGPSKFSSAICVQGKIFTVAEPAELICVDAADGKILWRQANGFDDLPIKAEPKPLRGEQGNTTPTPVSDGRFVYAAFGSGIVGCYDLDGRRQWIRYLEAPPGLEFGRSCSPVLSGTRLLVCVHHLFALDTRSGEIAWKNESVSERYGTPLAARIGGMEIVLMPTGQIVRGSDGSVLARATELPFTSPVMHDVDAYFIGPICSAVSLSKRGGDIAMKSLWKTELEGTYYASPVYAGGLLYSASNEGNFLIVDAADGKTVVTKELEIGSAAGRPDLPNANIYPSMTLAGNYIFLSNDIGETLVLETGRAYKEVKRNKLEEGFSGTPVFVGTRMYVRTRERVYGIGVK